MDLSSQCVISVGYRYLLELSTNHSEVFTVPGEGRPLPSRGFFYSSYIFQFEYSILVLDKYMWQYVAYNVCVTWREVQRVL